MSARPGLNAVIRAVVRRLKRQPDHQVIGIRKGWLGLLTLLSEEMDLKAVSGMVATPRIPAHTTTAPSRQPSGCASM
jgi:6-phosphofructokinase